MLQDATRPEGGGGFRLHMQPTLKLWHDGLVGVGEELQPTTTSNVTTTVTSKTCIVSSVRHSVRNELTEAQSLDEARSPT